MEKQCKEILDSVLESYKNKGIDLSYIPPIVIERVEESLGLVSTRIENPPGKLKLEEHIIIQYIIGKVLGEEETMAEIITNNPLQVSKYINRNLKTLYVNSFILEECPEELENAIAHDVWHLIESERKVIHSEPLIFESTANYASFIGRKNISDRTHIFPDFNKFKHKRLYKNISWYAYEAGAAIVTDIVEKEDGNDQLSKLLDLFVRKKIAEKYAQALENFLKLRVQ